MSSSKNLILLTESKDIFPLAKVIESALIDMVTSQRSSFADKGNQLPSITLRTHGCLEFRFVYKGESRIVSVHLYCDDDYKDETGEGKRLIVGLNDWGSAEEILLLLADRLHEYLKCQIYLHSDSLDNSERLY